MKNKKRLSRIRKRNRANQELIKGVLIGAAVTYFLTRPRGGTTIIIPELPEGPGTTLPTGSGIGLIRRRLLPLSLDAPLPAKYVP